MGSRSSYKTGFLRVNWVASGFMVMMCLLLVGCSNRGLPDSENATSGESIVLGLVQVEARGPIFRLHQAAAQVRFFDVKNTETGERTRVDMTDHAERFVTRLSPGHYELFRIQIGEGPFRSEAQVNMTFDVIAEKTNYLGVWRLQVDPPKTVRMLQWEVLAETPNLDPVTVLRDLLGDYPLEVSLPKPEFNQDRLFAVAPSQPRAKYFYRR